jgi:glycosyltransferase involved in cell wall biosynthesis
VLFFGDDVPEEDLAPFLGLASATVVRSPVFAEKLRSRRFLEALVLGSDRAAAEVFAQHGVDVVFENATFFGWRFPLPVIAWIPDFQHRHLRALFGARPYWKRELGFRAQVSSGRLIMLSSGDAEEDCKKFYPVTAGRTSVVRFAVPLGEEVLREDPAEVARQFGLPEVFFYLPNQFWVHKNHRLVIEAVHKAKCAGHSIVVAASGKPEDPRSPLHYAELQARVAELGLEDNFRFLGMVSRTQLVALMRTCSALLNPSLCEGWSTTVEEARTLGVPMLLSDLRVHREQMADAATYFDPHSAESLVQALVSFVPLPTAERSRAERAAIARSPALVRQFALDFAATVDLSLASRSHARG